MGFATLRDYFATGEVPRPLVPFAPVVAGARLVAARGIDLPSDVRSIYRTGIRRFRLPDGPAVAVQDAGSCVILWDTAPAQTGLTADRNFLVDVRLPELFDGLNNVPGGIPQQFREYGLASPASSVSLFWGVVSSVRYRARCRRNFQGACPLRGWHFRNLRFETGFLLEGWRNSLFLSVEPTVCAIVLTAIEKLAYLSAREA